jgi:DGQHR domain-containing protein
MAVDVKAVGNVSVGHQYDMNVYTYFLKIRDLKKIFCFDYYLGEETSLSDENGIQRIRTKKERRECVDHILSPFGCCPLPIWLNDRDKTTRISLSKDKRSAKIKFTKLNSLFVGDGGLRATSFFEAMESDIEGILDDYDVNIVMTQVDKTMERRIFLDINANSVKTKGDHNSAQYHQMLLCDGESRLKNKTEIVKGVAHGVALKLNQRKDSPLFEMLKFSGSNKYSKKEILLDPDKRDKKIMSATSFVNYLASDFISSIIYDNRYFDDGDSPDYKISEIAENFINFWKALKKVTPAEFWKNPQFYSFFSQLGIRATINLFAAIMQDMLSKKKKATISGFVGYVSHIPTLTDLNYWKNKKSWKKHPDYSSPLYNQETEGWKKHPDFKDCALMELAGSDKGCVIGRKLIKEMNENKPLSKKCATVK